MWKNFPGFQGHINMSSFFFDIKDVSFVYIVGTCLGTDFDGNFPVAGKNQKIVQQRG